jgi:hypothetical protein
MPHICIANISLGVGTKSPLECEPVARWVRCFWDEEAIWFYFELDADGYVTRQVEFQELRNKALAAASLAEWQVARSAGRLAEYENVYGLTAEPPISEWEGHEPQWLSANEFESVWSTARQKIQDRQRQRPS